MRCKLWWDANCDEMQVAKGFCHLVALAPPPGCHLIAARNRSNWLQLPLALQLIQSSNTRFHSDWVADSTNVYSPFWQWSHLGSTCFHQHNHPLAHETRHLWYEAFLTWWLVDIHISLFMLTLAQFFSLCQQQQVSTVCAARYFHRLMAPSLYCWSFDTIIHSDCHQCNTNEKSSCINVRRVL